jgi:O-antigen ligase
MILAISIFMAAIACFMLLLFSQAGVIAIYIARCFVDTSWSTIIFAGMSLTELFSVGVPLITFFLIAVNSGTRKSITKMPLYKFWLIYLLYIMFCAFNVVLTTSVVNGASIFFRYSNGFIGFYLAQAYFRGDNQIRIFFFGLAVAGIFPVAQGVYEAITNNHWSVTVAEGEVRNIGMYHDAITLRYYGLQTLLAVAACIGFKYPKNRIFQLGLWSLLLGSLLVVYKALSKAGVLIVASWACIWSYGRRSWMLPIVIILAIVFLVPFYFKEVEVTLYNQFHKEIGAISGDVATNRTFAGRWYIWDALWKQWDTFSIIKKMFGTGHEAFGAHNDYLQMLFTGGYVGLTLYVGLLLTIAWKLLNFYFRSKHLLATLGLMAFLMWIVDTIGLVPSLYSGYQWFVWGVVGLSLRYQQDSKTR